MAKTIVRRRRDGITEIVPHHSRRWDPHLTSLIALVLGTALYVSTFIQWTGAMVVVGFGCLVRELVHGARALMIRCQPAAPVEDLASRMRRAS